MTLGAGGSLLQFLPLGKICTSGGVETDPSSFSVRKSKGNPKGSEGFRRKTRNPRWHDKLAKRAVLWNKVYHATLSTEGGGLYGTYAQMYHVRSGASL